jgi:serine O-acetyltransferase
MVAPRPKPRLRPVAFPPPSPQALVRRQPQRYQDLEKAIDAVVESYEDDAEINNLESASLPNKRAVIEAFSHLMPVLYLGFYSPRSLNRDNPRHAIAEHMYTAHTLLVEQIERALTYEHWTNNGGGIPPAGSGEDVVLDLFGQLAPLRRVLNLDVLAAYQGDPAAASVEEVVFSYPSIMAITAYRIAHILHEAHVPMIPRIITEHAHSETGIDISPGARIGQSFFIDHGTGVVIGETSVIGRNVKLYQGVTLGALSVARRVCGEKRHPTLEDDVTVYAGATILGGDTIIGKGSVIGGNVWLVDSVPPGSKVFGRGRDGA